MRFREMEKILLRDGWKFEKAVGSHYKYRHKKKKGKVTVPRHTGDLDIRTVKSILKQAGIE